MAAGRRPAGPESPDHGTLCRTRSPLPGPLGSIGGDQCLTDHQPLAPTTLSGLDPVDKSQAIRVSLVKHWQDTSLQSNCSGFLKQVAKDQGITLEGRANDIIDFIFAHWELIPSATQAAAEAGKGAFVVAVLKGPDHADHRKEGHVAIVLPGAPQPKGKGATGGSYPLVWCAGGEGGKSDGTRTVGDVWREKDRNHVKYFKFVPKAN